MRFKEFITEDRMFTHLDGNSKELPDIIEKECSDILKIYRSTGKYLYRGEKDAKMNTVFKAGIHPERIPVQMDPSTHTKFKNAMIAAGFRAHRGNSIFTTGNTGTASEWGKTFIILPTNGFDYTWFDYDDRYSNGYVFNDIEEFSNRRRYQMAYTRMNDYGLDKINVELKNDPNYREKDTLEQYSKFGFNSDGSIRPWKEIELEIWKNFVTVSLGAMKTRLSEAVSDGKEVLFANCQYYGIPLIEKAIYKFIKK